MTYIIIPTYNEKETIENLVKEILGLQLDAKILIADDNSPDGTGKIADRLAANFPQVEVIHNPGKMGLGKATLGALRYAFDKGTDFAITMDADFSHKPKYIPLFLEEAKDNDFVIGSRHINGGKTNYPFFRKFLSYSANLFAAKLLGLKTHECTNSLRCYNRKALDAVLKTKITTESYVFLVEVFYIIQKSGLRIKELPIVFEDRILGESKMSSKEIFKGIKALSKLKMREISQK